MRFEIIREERKILRKKITGFDKFIRWCEQDRE
jgi:hypothetical protein